jgi:hypothetical protein
MQSGGVRSCTRSIQAPGKSISASRLASLASHSVSKRPIWLLEAGRTIEPVTANDRAHRGVAGEPLGVVDILVAGEPTEHRLAEQSAQLVAGILAAAAVEEPGGRVLGEPEGIVRCLNTTNESLVFCPVDTRAKSLELGED